MGLTHGFLLHPISRSVGLGVGWYEDIHFLKFYSILISALEYIRYLITSGRDVRNMSSVISSFDYVV